MIKSITSILLIQLFLFSSIAVDANDLNDESNDYAPIVTNIPGRCFTLKQINIQGPFYTIKLDDYVTDKDHEDSEIKWSFQAIDWFINDFVIKVNETRVASIRYKETCGAPWPWPVIKILFTATDPDGNNASDIVSYYINTQQNSSNHPRFGFGGPVRTLDPVGENYNQTCLFRGKLVSSSSHTIVGFVFWEEGEDPNDRYPPILPNDDDNSVVVCGGWDQWKDWKKSDWKSGDEFTMTMEEVQKQLNLQLTGHHRDEGVFSFIEGKTYFYKTFRTIKYRVDDWPHYEIGFGEAKWFTYGENITEDDYEPPDNDDPDEPDEPDDSKFRVFDLIIYKFKLLRNFFFRLNIK